MEKTFSDLVKESIRDEEDRISQINKKKKQKSLEDKISEIDWNKLKRKVKTNFFIGFGLGLVVAAMALWIFQPLSKIDIQDAKEKEVSDMTNSEIIERAKVLGMDFPK